MRDEMELLREARPFAAGPTTELVRASRRELMMQITAARPTRPLRRRGLLVAVAAALAVSALVGVTLSGPGGDKAWAAEVVRVAQAAPRLLVGAPGWKIARADEFSVDFGEMTFRNGEQELELRWERGAELAAKLEDRASSADLATTAQIAGTKARVFRYEGTTDFTAIWPRGDYTLEARGARPDVEAFKTLIGALHEVDVDTWLSAMPESVVKPRGGDEVVAAMLEGVPLPSGFDTAGLVAGDAVRDRYQLGAQVAGAVACAWIDQWVAARHAGDDSGARQAVGAMATSHQWPVLRELESQGDYPKVLWMYADAMTANAPVSGGKESTVEESYRSALGCSMD